MTPLPPYQLLSVDEARNLLGGTSIALVDTVRCRPERLARLLTGTGTVRGLPTAAAEAIRAHRTALRRVRALGLEWLIGDELEGALSYARLDQTAASARAA